MACGKKEAIDYRCGRAIPLVGCAFGGFLDCARVLVEFNPDVNLRQPHNQTTALMNAVHGAHDAPSGDSTGMVTFLLDAGADPNLVCGKGLSAADYALGGDDYVERDEPGFRYAMIAAPAILRILHAAGCKPAKLKREWASVIANGYELGSHV